jgi:hypothetical protein
MSSHRLFRWYSFPTKVDNIGRRTWDMEEFERKAQEKLEAEENDFKEQNSESYSV